MTLVGARLVRREARGYGYHSVVPLGFGPDGYFARIFSTNGDGSLLPIDFHSRAEFRVFHARRLRERRRLRDVYRRGTHRRSPIEAMVDRAVGLK